jgi:hypothetical protein
MNKPTTSLTEAVQGDRHSALIALRDTLAAALDNHERPAHTTAPLARQLQSVLKELAEIPSPDRPTLASELARRRSERIKANPDHHARHPDHIG